MDAKTLIQVIKETGITTDEAILEILEDGEAMGRILRLPYFRLENPKTVVAHIKAQFIVEDARSQIQEALFFDQAMAGFEKDLTECEESLFGWLAAS
ncbi:hypothetical protein A6M27_02695 [Acidithiobacillus thiooxidans]|uniref:Uncharacterized protein n=1 Tax=Acidithiobacillus thiooxidans TaxID=930 RepID=A0A1C2IJW9_ACITH|nr:hypothetical protein [Acidithiobacillus thiooxidans]OCX71663.1 hypothetical protein A6O24_15220 [Acidithiobacillus thiooxidans]OCX76272.1 hypothetical protein A6P07_02955 [Acidithiobacillus thiooxidans]OCX78476.1 hypothetical protein A6O26_18005 [Acidithiobacillus thiooxidans]OCX89257.1 hypothetical protein A6M27_02695 [Acidithiobacillus thiooxidans]OFC42627.1 hypothetical protein BAE47_14865 [Acidithiobacillus thiooxidans]